MNKMDNNYNLCCRTCLQYSDEMYDLFSLCDGDGTVTAAHMLSSCTSLKIESDDGLPKNLCETCCNKLNDAYLYRKQAVASDVTLRACLKTNCIVKLEQNIQIKIEYDNGDEENVFEGQDLSELEHEEYEFKHKNIGLAHKSNNFELQDKECNRSDCLQDSDEDDDTKPLIEIKKENEIVMKRSLKNYACPMCLAVFSKLAEKKRHTKEKHPNAGGDNANYQCKMCPKDFPTYLKLQRHTVLHAAVRPFHCTICLKSFRNKRSFANHLLKHRNEANFNEGSFSSVGFKELPSRPKQAARTGKHADSVSYKDTFECEVCCKKFQSRFSLSAHMGKHTEPRSYSCTQCDKKFSKKSFLQRHENIHVKTPLSCEMCNETFENRRLMILHLKKQHKGSQQFSCQFCPKEFTHKSSLTAHLEVHMGLKSYLCPTCGKQFEGASNLKRHIKRHLGDKSFACGFCTKKFVTKGELKAHTVMHTGDRRWKCDLCDVTFTKSTSLTKHKQSHLGVKPYQCDICHLTYLSKDHLNRHYRIHTGERPYKCEMCASSFKQHGTLLKHRRLHLGENIYGCNQCQERFRLMSELNKHLSEHYVAQQAALSDGANVETALDKETSDVRI